MNKKKTTSFDDYKREVSSVRNNYARVANKYKSNLDKNASGLNKEKKKPS